MEESWERGGGGCFSVPAAGVVFGGDEKENNPVMPRSNKSWVDL